VHRHEPCRSIFAKLADQLGVALREESRDVRYSGDFYGQTAKGEPLHDAISAEALAGIIRSLPPGMTELGCHPGEQVGEVSVYAAERELEVSALCSPLVRETVRACGVELRPFAARSTSL
jgi:predicted glycoside hydrolase/deacetylase ChbG (UPF0249 family)